METAACVLCNGWAERVAVASQPEARKSKSTRKTPETSPTYYGHPWSEWFAMRDAVLTYIGEKARSGKKTTYGELWSAIEARLGKDLGNPHYQLPSLLGYAATEGFEQTNLVVTALVIYEGRPEMPGDGFFKIAAEFGIFDEKDAPEDGREWTEMNPTQRSFWEQQVRDLFALYSSTSTSDDDNSVTVT
jgi:hypothetical protein